MAHTIVLTSNRPAIAAIMTTALIVHLPDLNPRSDSAFWAAPIVHQIAEPGLLEVNKPPAIRDSRHQHLEIGQHQIANRHNRATVEVLSADGYTAFGIRNHWLVTDELAAWPATDNTQRLWTAIVSAAPKIPGCREVHSQLSVQSASLWATRYVRVPMPPARLRRASCGVLVLRGLRVSTWLGPLGRESDRRLSAC